MRILVADDSPTIQKVIKIALARYSVEIVAVRTFSEAMAEASKGPFSACLVDAGLPGAKTPDDFLALQRQAADAPVVLLVGTYESFDDKVYSAAGLREIVRKPFESSNITRTLSRVVGKGFDSSQLSSFATQAGVLGGKTLHGSQSFLPPLTGETRTSENPPRSKPPLPPVPMTAQEASESTGPIQIPPPPLTDEKRRGQKAFTPGSDADRDFEADAEMTQVIESLPRVPPPPGRMTTPPDLGREKSAASLSKSAAEGTMSGMERDKLEALIRNTVLEYCAKNFSSLAREVLTAEIRRLAEERSKHLVDQ